MAKRKPINLTVVIDENSYECLYVDGKAWESKGDITVYCSDLVNAADGRLVDLEHKAIEFTYDEWPDDLKDALNPPR